MGDFFGIKSVLLTTFHMEIRSALPAGHFHTKPEKLPPSVQAYPSSEKYLIVLTIWLV